MTSIDRSRQAARADELHRLHTTEESTLVLANAWDVASARVIEDAGASAIATTSAGVAWSLGASDGDHISRELVVDLVRRIVAAVGIPVTADVETGYGDDDTELAATIHQIVEAGAVGINIEDSGFDPLRPADEQAHRIGVVRAAAEAAGVRLFVNARTDAFLMQAGAPESRLEETLRRAKAYLAAGADGIFVPGVGDPEVIAALVGGIDAPVNILVGPGSPTVGELRALGVRRVSAGSALAQAVYGHTRRGAEELFEAGTYDALTDPYDYARMNQLFLR